MVAKKTRTARRTLKRVNVKRPLDTGETIETLEERLVSTPTPKGGPEPRTTFQLERNRIKVAGRAFQWRIPKRNQLPSDDHIFTLARALQRGDKLPPILVFVVGEDFYVVDGHHRLAAYDTLGWKKTITAEVFVGNLRDAERAALRGNNRDKLPLTPEDRTEAAWRLVRQKNERDSIKTIMEDTGASKGSVNNMRAALAKLEEQGHTADDIKGFSWSTARRKAENTPEDKDHGDWIEAEAQKLVDDILRYKLGARLTKNPDVTAVALLKLNPALPEALMAEWAPEPAFDPNDESEDMPF